MEGSQNPALHQGPSGAPGPFRAQHPSQPRNLMPSRSRIKENRGRLHLKGGAKAALTCVESFPVTSSTDRGSDVSRCQPLPPESKKHAAVRGRRHGVSAA